MQFGRRVAVSVRVRLSRLLVPEAESKPVFAQVDIFW